MFVMKRVYCQIDGMDSYENFDSAILGRFSLLGLNWW